MKKRTKITLWSILFVIVFTVSALIRVNLLGSAPMRLMQVKWDDTVGTIYNDLNYEMITDINTICMFLQTLI